VQLSRLVAVAEAAPVQATLVGLGVQMRGHLGFEHRLDNAVDEGAEEIWAIGQDGLCRRRDAGTLSVCHRLPP
jgi:hypothetical protein